LNCASPGPIAAGQSSKCIKATSVPAQRGVPNIAVDEA
jgi:hypothetical protein